MTTITRRDTKTDSPVPQEGTFRTLTGEELVFEIDPEATTDYPLRLELSSSWLSLEEVRDIRKFLRKVERQLIERYKEATT
jgi:hypothetical protein